MIPYGDKANVGTYYSYPITISENKHAIGHCQLDIWGEHLSTSDYYGRINTENRIGNGKFNNLYAYAPVGGYVGLLAQHPSWFDYKSSGTGYGLLYQDNYEDRPEIRCYNYYGRTTGRYSGTRYVDSSYSKNGYCTCSFVQRYGGGYSWNWYTNAQASTPIYKTSTAQYYGMFPVFSPSEQAS